MPLVGGSTLRFAAGDLLKQVKNKCKMSIRLKSRTTPEYFKLFHLDYSNITLFMYGCTHLSSLSTQEPQLAPVVQCHPSLPLDLEGLQKETQMWSHLTNIIHTWYNENNTMVREFQTTCFVHNPKILILLSSRSKETRNVLHLRSYNQRNYTFSFFFLKKMTQTYYSVMKKWMNLIVDNWVSHWLSLAALTRRHCKAGDTETLNCTEVKKC